MRPHYESQQDRDRETEVAGLVARRLGLEPLKLHEHAYRADFALYSKGGHLKGSRGELRALIEVRCRDGYGHSSFTHYMTSLHKYLALCDYARALPSVRVRLIVRFADGIFSHEPDPLCLDAGIGGRDDRKDNVDIEPVAFLPMDTFIRMDLTRSE